MADYAANISVKVKGLDDVEKLENAVKGLRDNLSKVTKAAVNPFQGQIAALKTVNKLLQANAKLLNKMSATTVARTVKTPKQAKGPEIDNRLLKEQVELLERSLSLVQKKNQGLSQSANIADKEARIQKELNKGTEANLTLVRSMLANARQVVAIREKEEKEIASVTANLKMQVDIATSLRAALGDGAAAFKKGLSDSLNVLKQAGKLARDVGKVSGSVGKAFAGKENFNKATEVVKDGAIRGAAAGTAILGAQALDAASSFQVFGRSLDFLQGPIGEVVHQTAQLSGNLGLAAVAAMAFAPALGSVAKAAKDAAPGLEDSLLGTLNEELPDTTKGVEKLTQSVERYNKAIRDSARNAIGQGFRDLTGAEQVAKDNAVAERAYGRSSASKAEASKRAAAAKAEAEAAKQAAEATRQQALALQQLSAKYGALIPQVAEYQRLTKSINAVTSAAANLEKTRANYFETTNRSMQKAIQKTREYTQVVNQLNGATRAPARQPALRPSGMSDADVLRMNQNGSTFGADRPFAPGSNPNMTPVSRAGLNNAAALKAEMVRLNGLADELEGSWEKLNSSIKRTVAETKKLAVEDAKRQASIEMKIKARKEEWNWLTKIGRELRKNALIENGRKENNKSRAAGKLTDPDFGENFALGVGFPLLFGGGPGSVAGSGLGSFFGKGFGGQILGGAIGQILDQAVASAAKLGNALNDLNMDSLIEDGIAFNSELQQTIDDLKKAGDYAGARDVAGREIGKQTGDFGGKQLELAAGSVNELSKAWDGLMAGLKVAVGTLLAPFIQALTAILRLVQAIVVVWNSIVDLIGKAGRWLGNLVGLNSDKLYDKTRRNTAEYEKQNKLLREQIKLTEQKALNAAVDARFSEEETRLNGLIKNGTTLDDRQFNAGTKYAQDLLSNTKEYYKLQREEEQAINDIRKEFAGADPALIKQKIDAEKIYYEQMYEQVNNKKIQLEQNYARTAEQLLNERANEELRAAEAAQQLRRRGMSLERSAEDLRLNAEQTIYNLRRQAMAIETAATELRMSVADRIYSQGKQNAEMQLEISRRREQLAINERDMLMQARKSYEGIDGEEIFNRIIDGERQLQRLKSEALADKERREKKLAIDIADIDREQKKFELQVAKRIEQIKQQVADYERAAAQAELMLSRAAADLKIAAADYAVEKRKEEIKLMEEAAARLATSMLAQQLGGAYTNTAKPGSSSQVKALVDAANQLGISARDLAAIISYETGGSMKPNIWGGTGGNYMGLIQFGPEERRMYGANENQTFEQQLPAVVRYFKDRFAGVGRSTQGATLSDLYRTVNGGNPNASLSASDGNGTIAQHIQKIRTNHGRVADTFLGGNVDITRAVEEGTTAGIEQAREGDTVGDDPASTAAIEAATTSTASTAAIDEARAAAAAAIGQIPATPSPDTNVDDLLAKSKELAETRKELLALSNQTANDEAAQRIAQQELQNAQQMKQIYLELVQPIRQIQEQQEITTESKRRELELIMNGMLPAQVQQTLEIEKQVNAQIRKIEGAIGLLEAEVSVLQAKEGATEEDEKQVLLLQEKIALLRQAANEVQTRGASAVQGAAAANSPQARMQEQVKNAKSQLNELQDPVNILTQSANTMGDAFGEAFKGIVTGSMTAQEALAGMLQRVADSFIDMATDMLTQYVKLILMQTVLNALGGPSFGSSPVGSQGNPLGMGGALPLNGMATGGRPKTGEPIIVGERGPEIFTPDSSGSIGSNRYFDAARDSMSHDADTASSNVTEQRDSQFYEAMQSPEGREMNVRYDATIINEVEYVTADQFQRGMKDTATRARAETLKDLRNYPGKRAAVGLR